MDRPRVGRFGKLVSRSARCRPLNVGPIMHLQTAILDMIRQAWAWTGIDPLEVVASNAFGNVIIRSTKGSFWRICPEELSCTIVAKSEDEWSTLRDAISFVQDWEMARLVELAQAKLGPISVDRCYCLKLPAVVGGKYDASNLGTNSRVEVLAFAGDLAHQIKDLPDGAKVRLVVTE